MLFTRLNCWLQNLPRKDRCNLLLVEKEKIDIFAYILLKTHCKFIIFHLLVGRQMCLLIQNLLVPANIQCLKLIFLARKEDSTIVSNINHYK